MPKFYPSLPDDLAAWCNAQPVFWVSSAPLQGRHVNISPKGTFSSAFRILSASRVAYIDLTGSGAETIAHCYEPGNARVTVLFNSFDVSPRILRLFCTGSVVERGARGWAEVLEQMGVREEEYESARAVIVLDVWKCQTSCGFGVPYAQSWRDRKTLQEWGGKVVRAGDMPKYQKEWNRWSLDGLGALRSAGGRKRWRQTTREMAPVLWVLLALLVGVVVGVNVAVLREVGREVVKRAEGAVMEAGEAWASDTPGLKEL